MGKRKYVHYATEDLVKQINPENMKLWNRFLSGKKQLSPKTIESYQSDINQFFVYILLNYNNQYLFDMEIEDASDMIDDFIAMCTTVFENKDKRIARRLSSISSMYLYYKKRRKIKENPVDFLERPKIQKGKYEIKQTFLNSKQVEIIRENLEKETKNKTQLKLFFELGLLTMARVNALSSIKIKQINFDNCIIEGITEKEGYEVEFLFDENCKELMLKWIEERKENGIENEFLFITKYNNEWTNAKSSMQNTWIKKIGCYIDEPELHVHDLRHSGSNLLYQSGMPLEVVSSLLNHKGTDVTRSFYLKEDKSKLRSELMKYKI